MEATGSYWKAVWQLLEGRFESLANRAQVKNLLGRKSDVNDATWMADLHAHRLIRGSFVPPAEISALGPGCGAQEGRSRRRATTSRTTI
jgi:transposase